VNLATETAMVRVMASGNGHPAALDSAERGLDGIDALAGELAQVATHVLAMSAVLQWGAGLHQHQFPDIVRTVLHLQLLTNKGYAATVRDESGEGTRDAASERAAERKQRLQEVHPKSAFPCVCCFCNELARLIARLAGFSPSCSINILFTGDTATCSGGGASSSLLRRPPVAHVAGSAAGCHQAAGLQSRARCNVAVCYAR
jgi:hypothetical protein